MSKVLRQATIGVVFIVIMVALVVLALLQFNRAFDSTFPIKVQSDRAGLLMDSGAKVKMRGAVVGYVGDITPSEGGALLTLDLIPDQAGRVPSNVKVNIVPPTAFGAKYVDLLPPEDPAGAIAENTRLSGADVTVEVNQTFSHLVDVLRAVSPQDLNSALNALSTAVDGRGEQLGEFLVDLNRYLKGINPSLSVLRSDLVKAKPVLNLYANVAPDLLDTTTNLSRTSDTLVQKSAALNAFLLSFTKLANDTTSFADTVRPSLVTALDVLTPTTRLLSKYSGELPCLLGGLTVTNKLLEPVIGGNGKGINVYAGFLPPMAPYKYPDDLPKVAAASGPNCYGLPNLVPGQVPAHQAFDVGPNPYTGAETKPGFNAGSLARLLFGPLSNLVTPK